MHLTELDPGTPAVEALADRLPVGVYRTTVDGRIEYVNPAMAKLLGFSTPADALNVHAGSVYADPSVRRSWMSSMERFGEVKGLEYELRRPDGRAIWVRDSARAVSDSEGRPLYYEGVVEDVTPRREAESARLEQIRLMGVLQAVGANAAAGTSLAESARALVPMILRELSLGLAHLWVVDRGGPSGAPVRQLRRTAAWESEDIDRSALPQGLLAEDRLATPRALPWDALDGDTHWAIPAASCDARFASSPELDASAEALLLVAIPIAAGHEVVAVLELASPGGSPPSVGLLGALTQVGVHLGHVAERERAATDRNRSIQRAFEMQKLEAVGRLAGGVAHDLNNLMAVVSLQTELLLLECTDVDGSRSSLESVKRAVDRAVILVHQLLSFARQQRAFLEPLRPTDVVAGIDRMLAQAVGSQIALELDLMQGCPPVRADRGQIEQVLSNLVINAGDATDDGGRVRVGVRDVRLDPSNAPRDVELADGHYVCIEVSDSGRGIPESMRAHLFEPFFTTKPVGTGTGLGLAASFGIVRALGGAISVETREGVGSTFRVFLPVLETDSPNIPVESESRSPDPSGTERILVVEDEDEVRATVVGVLEAAGYDVTEARDGVEALQLLDAAAGGFDLVLSDIVMPRAGGRELLRKIRFRWPGQRVLLTSGYEAERPEPEPTLAPEPRILSKPYDIASLLRMVRAELDGIECVPLTGLVE